jgi:iron-sulfur cluster assembly protein
MDITLTKCAADQVKNFMASEDNSIGVRIGIKTTGCSGFMYVVELSDHFNSQDEVFDSHGIKIGIDSESLKYLKGTEIDFTKEGLNEGFRFNNPNAAATCGCGESFSI